MAPETESLRRRVLPVERLPLHCEMLHPDARNKSKRVPSWPKWSPVDPGPNGSFPGNEKWLLLRCRCEINKAPRDSESVHHSAIHSPIAKSAVLPPRIAPVG